MDLKTVAAIAIAVISPSLVYYFGVRSSRIEATRRFKEERYGNLLVLLQGAYIADTASAESKQAFLGEFYRSWLYCSPTVLAAINTFTQLFQGGRTEVDATAADPRMEQIVLAMRRDLGTSTTLPPGSFKYTYIQDSSASNSRLPPRAANASS